MSRSMSIGFEQGGELRRTGRASDQALKDVSQKEE